MKIKTISLLLGLLHLGSASALGLGDLTVRSSLGQPLHATVTILGAKPDTTSDCFSVGASTGGLTPLARAQLTFERAGSKALLHIRTSQTLNDPVAQFALTSDCEARLTRDYIVLLDPPDQVAPSVTISNLAPVVQSVPTPIEKAQAPAVRRTTPRKPKIQVSAARLAAAENAAANTPASAATHAPRLVISGRHGSGANVALALRLDTNLPDLMRTPAAPMTETEVSDENTALTRKLAYLETQLASLQLRNADLEARRTATTTPKPASNNTQASNTRWLWYILLVALLIGAGILAAWLLRRGRPRRTPLVDDAPWTATDDDDVMPGLPPTKAELAVKKTGVAHTVKPVSVASIEMAPLEAESTEVKDDILDQAEVYMAHGHGELAVHLLQEHLRESPSESPIPWLLLMDLLQRDGDAVAYAEASTECRRYFNIKLTGPSSTQDGEAAQGLEAYPLILKELVRVWKLPEATAFFDELIYDNRGGTRVGFEPNVYRDILMLRAIAEQDAEPKAT